MLSLNPGILKEFNKFIYFPEYKLRKWIDPDSLNFMSLCENVHDGTFNLIKNIVIDSEKIYFLCKNPSIYVLEIIEDNICHMDEWCWINLTSNENIEIVLYFVEKHLSKFDKILGCWYNLTKIQDRRIIPYISSNISKLDKLCWINLCKNKMTFNQRFVLDYIIFSVEDIDLLQALCENESERIVEYLTFPVDIFCLYRLTSNENPKVVDILIDNLNRLDDLCLCNLASNASERHLKLLFDNFRESIDDLIFYRLCSNPSDVAVDYVIQSLERLDDIAWGLLNTNPNDKVIDILKHHPDMINIEHLTQNFNPRICELIDQKVLDNLWCIRNIALNPGGVEFLDKFIGEKKIQDWQFWYNLSQNPMIFMI